MSPDEQYIRPPSLRAYLDRGGDLSGFALLDSLVEAVVVARRLLPADNLHRALQLVDDLRHVHPLAVREEMENWTCRACGETFALAPAAVVTNTGEELGYDEDLSYCLGCMSIATAALEAASGIDRFSEGLDDERHRLRPIGRLTDALTGDDDDDELILVDGAFLDDDLDDDTGELVLDDLETVRTEAARLTNQLETAGRYGFSVRVVPSHDDLRTFAELGCVAWAAG